MGTPSDPPGPAHLGPLAERGPGYALGRLVEGRLVSARFCLPRPPLGLVGLDGVAFAQELASCPQLHELEDLSLGIWAGDSSLTGPQRPSPLPQVLGHLGFHARRLQCLRRLRVGTPQDALTDDLLPGWALEGHAVGAAWSSDDAPGEHRHVDLGALGGVVERCEALLIGASGVDPGSRPLPALRRLAVVCPTEVQPETSVALSRLEAPLLEELVVASRTSAVEVDPFLSVSWPSLRRLALRTTLGTGRLLRALVGPPLWPRLTHLDLSGGTLQDRDVEVLLRQSHWPALLDLTANLLSGEATAALQARARALGSVVITSAQQPDLSELTAHFWAPGEGYHQVSAARGEAPIVVANLRRGAGPFQAGDQVFVHEVLWGPMVDAKVVGRPDSLGPWLQATLPVDLLTHARLRRLTNPDVLGLLDGEGVHRGLVEHIPSF